MNENNRCMGCGELKEEVDLEDLVDYCDDCNGKMITKVSQVTVKLENTNQPVTEESIFEDAVVYAVETLPDDDRARLANGKGSEQWQNVVKELASSLYDIIKGKKD